jgi:hypothetical protein
MRARELLRKAFGPFRADAPPTTSADRRPSRRCPSAASLSPAPGPQASFLRQLTPAPRPASKWDQDTAGPPAAAAAAEAGSEALGAAHGEAAALLLELKGLSEEELERRCRTAGLGAKGGRCVHPGAGEGARGRPSLSQRWGERGAPAGVGGPRL